MEKIGLVEAIDMLRAELTQSAERATGQGIRFHVDQVDVEFEVVAERVTKGSVGLKLWVVEADAGHERVAGRTHRVTVSLRPETSDGRPFFTREDKIPG